MKDTQAHLHALRQGANADQRLLIELLIQIWQIDPSVPASQVCERMLAADVHYFHTFVHADAGVDFQEQSLLNQVLPLKDREGEDWKGPVREMAERAKGLGPG